MLMAAVAAHMDDAVPLVLTSGVVMFMFLVMFARDMAEVLSHLSHLSMSQLPLLEQALALSFREQVLAVSFVFLQLYALVLNNADEE